MYNKRLAKRFVFFLHLYVLAFQAIVFQLRKYLHNKNLLVYPVFVNTVFNCIIYKKKKTELPETKAKTNKKA